MSGYRCVNYYDLCRLCTASQGAKVHIFSEEGKKRKLYDKILESLPISVDEKDKLPKILCNACLQQVENIAEFRETCVQAQQLLESCLNSAKLRNGGQVYIKDAPPRKPANPAPSLAPTFTFTTATPAAQKHAVSIAPNTMNSELLSSLIQAVGIQTNDDQSGSVVNQVVEQQQQQQQMQTQQAMPQYTLTIDGQTFKAGTLQYKVADQTQNQVGGVEETASSLVDEFLKIKGLPKQITARKIPVAKPAAPKVVTASIDLCGSPPKVQQEMQQQQQQKPKINFVLSTPTKTGAPQQIPITLPTTQSGTKTVSLQDLKILTANKNVVPIVVKSDGTIETNTQLLSQIASAAAEATSPLRQQQQAPPLQPPPPPPQAQQQQQTFNPPVAFIQLKIQPNGDGQPVMQLMPAPTQPTTIQLPAPFQNLNLQQQLAQQIQTQINQTLASQAAAAAAQNAPTISIAQPVAPPPTITMTQQAPPHQQHQIQIQQQQQQPAPSQQVSVNTQVSSADIMMSEASYTPAPPTPQHETITTSTPAPASTATKTTTVSVASGATTPAKKPKMKLKQERSPDGGGSGMESLMAQMQMQTITATKYDGPDPPSNLTNCEVCHKVFKRKEHLMQHLKSHIGLRPFKCITPGCNKSFSRKEHLMRHEVSHTGKKLFSCDLCHKFFSRKDNLNKHRRTHPEANNSNQFHCETCGRSFVVKSSYLEHKQLHEMETADNNENVEVKPKVKRTVVKSQPKIKVEKEEIVVAPAPIAPTTTTSVMTSPPPPQPQMTIQAQAPPQIAQHQQQQVMQVQLVSAPSQVAQMAFNHTTTQATKTTTILKQLGATTDGTLFSIPTSNIQFHSPITFMSSTGELQLGYKVENN